MTPTRLVVALVLVAVAGVAIVPAVSAGPVTDVSNETNATESASNTTVATFMQTSAVDTEQTVESGLFDAAFDNASNERQAELVTDRTDDLEAQLESLESEYDELHAEDKDSSPVDEVRLTKLTVSITSLERSIERTKLRANDAGVDDDRLEALHSNASDLAGSEVAAKARGLNERNQSVGPPIETETAANRTPAERSDTGPPKDDSSIDDSGPPAGEDGSPPSSTDTGANTDTDDDGPVRSENDGGPPAVDDEPSETETGAPDADTHPPNADPGPPDATPES